MKARPPGQAGSGRHGCIRRYGRRRQPLARVVCFPWCGAGASVFRGLAAELPDHVELLAVQLPGREDRFSESRLRRMEHVADHVIDDVIGFSEQPLLLFGHSMGALVAYEVARQLQQRTGCGPALLIASGHGSPGVRGRLTQLHTADEEVVIRQIRCLGGTPSAVLDDRDMMRALIPLLKADYEVLETYIPQAGELLRCPLVACAGEEDPEVTPDTIHAWAHMTTGPCQVRWFRGDHFYLCKQPAKVARCIEHWIDRLNSGAGW